MIRGKKCKKENHGNAASNTNKKESKGVREALFFIVPPRWSAPSG